MEKRLKLSEIFKSIQGESSFAGLACTFIRLAGCNLRCSYCDTVYAYEPSFELTVEEILTKVASLGCPLVEITGGEPLLQEEVYPLMAELLTQGYQVLLETNGTIDLTAVDPRAVVIMDIKCPGSGQSEKVLWDNLKRLREKDQVKFVLSHRQDYDWARGVIEKHGLEKKCLLLFSPAYGFLSARDLAQWILSDPDLSGKVRLQLQLHKIIWGGEARGV